MAGRAKASVVAAPAPALLLLCLLTAAAAEPVVHTLVATECQRYFTWQSIGMAFSFRKAGQPGMLTRLMSCTEEAWDALPEADKALSDEIPTHRCPSYSYHPRTGDYYPGINKPVAVADWLAHTDVADDDYILLIDADMVMRLPVLPQELGAAPGTAVSGSFGYMIGVDNELALRHVPEVEPRMDDVAGPIGRRGDQVGGFTLMQVGDMRRVAPWWIKYSEDVRADPMAWNLTGDVYARKDEKPWIAEMYGYSFGAAKADVWHKADPTFQHYPGYEVWQEHVKSPPKVLHFGILWNVTGGHVSESVQFDKHWFEQFDALSCPPWQLSQDPHQTTQGLFPHPPAPSQFNHSGYAYLRDLFSVLATLNEAFCERYRRVCPSSEQLERECGRAEALAREIEAAFASFVPPAAVEGPDSEGSSGAAPEAGAADEEQHRARRAGPPPPGRQVPPRRRQQQQDVESVRIEL